MDHTTGRIHRSKWLERAIAESELAIVVILNNHCIGLLGPLEECLTAFKRHRHADGKLVRRRDVYEPGVGWQRGDGQTFAIEWHGLNASANCFEEPPCRRIPGIFDRDAITPFNEDLRDEVERLLSSVGDGDGFGVDVHSSGQPDVPGYRGAQCRMPGWI